MINRPRHPAPRWIGLVTSVMVLVLVAGAVAFSNARVRNHVPGLRSGPVPTPTPAGLVISLSQLPPIDILADAPTPAADTRADLAPLQQIPTGAAAVASTGDTTAAATPAATAATTAGTSVASQTPSTATTAATTTAATTGTPTASTATKATAGMPTIAATTAPTPTTMVATATTTPATPTAAPAPTAVAKLPSAVFLEPMKHWYQGWNQCAEMSASMALSYFGINLDPNNVTAELRPTNGPTGTKNVEFPRIVEFLQSQGVHAQAFQGGTPDRVKRLVAQGVPVIVGQWQNRGDHAGIGHWRVVRGYDDAKGVFIVNDSMIDPASPISYAEFDDLWSVYDYVYIPVWNDKLAPRVQAVMGDDMNAKVNITHAIAYDQMRIEQQPTNAELYFALGGSYYLSGDNTKALDYYHKAKNMGLIQKYPWTLWYQSWPVAALVDTGAYDEALQTAQQNIDSAKTFAIMHYQRGRVFELRGDMTGAKNEYQLALKDDKNLKDAQTAMSRIGG